MSALVRTTRSERRQLGITFIPFGDDHPGIGSPGQRPPARRCRPRCSSRWRCGCPGQHPPGKIDDGWTSPAPARSSSEAAASPHRRLRDGREIGAAAARQPGPSGGRLIDDPASPANWPTPGSGPRCSRSLEVPHADHRAQGGNPGPAASSMLKTISTELSQALTELPSESPVRADGCTRPHATRPGGPDRRIRAARRRLPQR